MSHRKQSRMNVVAMMMMAGGLAAALSVATEPANAQNPGVSNQPRGGLGGPDTRPENFGIKQGTANKGGAVSIQDGGGRQAGTRPWD